MLSKDDETVNYCLRNLCKKCLNIVQNRLRECPIIIGNIKYKPWVELSRKWIDDDDFIENVTKEEYDNYPESRI